MEEENKQPESNLKERICPYCKEPYKTKVGIDNWKNLFRKPTMEDWITLVILALLILASYAYTQETAQCKNMIQNLDETCADYTAMRLNLTHTETSVNTLVMPNISGYYEQYYEKYNATLINYTSNSSGNVIGGEKDEHGCIIPAGYSWCESLQECIRSWETNCSEAVASSKVKVNVTTMSNSSNASIKP